MTPALTISISLNVILAIWLLVKKNSNKSSGLITNDGGKKVRRVFDWKLDSSGEDGKRWTTVANSVAASQ